MAKEIVSNTKTHLSGAIESKAPFNWPIVSFLLFMTAIPGIPAIFLIAIVLLGPNAIEGISSSLNQLHFDTPLAIVVHGGAGVLFFLSMPFQFSPALRVKGSKWHKRGGYVAVISGYIMAISGIWMHHVLMPDTYGPRYVSLLLVSIGMCLGFTIALKHIFARDIQSHIKWMSRSVAISLSVVSPIFLEIPIYLAFSQFEGLMGEVSKVFHDFDRIIGLVFNLAVLEFWIRRVVSRRQGNLLPEVANA